MDITCIVHLDAILDCGDDPLVTIAMCNGLESSYVDFGKYTFSVSSVLFHSVSSV